MSISPGSESGLYDPLDLRKATRARACNRLIQYIIADAVQNGYCACKPWGSLEDKPRGSIKATGINPKRYTLLSTPKLSIPSSPQATSNLTIGVPPSLVTSDWLGVNIGCCLCRTSEITKPALISIRRSSQARGSGSGHHKNKPIWVCKAASQSPRQRIYKTKKWSQLGETTPM